MLQSLSLFAQEAPKAPAQQPDGGLFNSPYFPLYLIGMFFLLWVVVLRPASKRQENERQQMLANLKRGTKVATVGGIIGTVINVKEGEDEITIRSEDARLKVQKSSVARVLGTDEAETK